ncbi:DCL family protein [Marinimicrobium agarilyticum]|uniref:DCL family protein n=1 Tax=Marinimicrobium agarilyticum TaxID=306546 RepID=UPI0009FF5877|nr:DCL family protein [Marinimicrobium agarilyticum]
MSKPISFGNFQFRTKKSATEEVRRRINKYEFGDKLNIEDELFFTSLFTLHSEYKNKKGVGIDHIKVERDFHNNRCLYIHRVDGSKVDCSWTHCIRPAPQKSIVSIAFRRAVKDIITSFKREQLAFVKSCPELGTDLSMSNSHASYTGASFENLVDDFLNLNNLTYESITLTNPAPGDEDQRGIISNPEIINKWIEYHYKNASIMILSKEANLRKLKQQLLDFKPAESI